MPEAQGQAVIAKLNRLPRNLAFIAQLMDAGVEFVAVDNLHANKLTIHILAAVAQHEREMIGERTRRRCMEERKEALSWDATELNNYAALQAGRPSKSRTPRTDP